MNTHPDHTAFLRRSLQLDGIARVDGALLVVYAALLRYNAARATVGRAGAVAAAVLRFTMLEVVGLARLHEMAG